MSPHWRGDMSEARKAYKNTDTELWRERPDDYYSPSVHVTQDGELGINVGGLVTVASLRQWHRWAEESELNEGRATAYQDTLVIALKILQENKLTDEYNRRIEDWQVKNKSD